MFTSALSLDYAGISRLASTPGKANRTNTAMSWHYPQAVLGFEQQEK
jgi:hypothetical protein